MDAGDGFGVGAGASGRGLARKKQKAPKVYDENYFVKGTSVGVRELNNIRAYVGQGYFRGSQRFGTLEPMTMPTGLEHLAHLPKPPLVNGGKDYHRGCGFVEIEPRITRQRWKSHYDWVDSAQERRHVEKKTNNITFPPIDLDELPPSMKNCYNRFARKWTDEGIEVRELAYFFKSPVDEELEAVRQRRASIPYDSAYLDFVNRIGWRTKEQLVLVPNVNTHANPEPANKNAGAIVEVHSRSPQVKGVNVDKLQQQQQIVQQQQHHHHHHHHSSPQQQQKRPGHDSDDDDDENPDQMHKPNEGGRAKTALMDDKKKKTYQQQQKGRHIRYDEKNIEETFHPAGKDYGHIKIDEPPTPYRRSTGENYTPLSAEELKLLQDRKSKESAEAEARRSSVRDKAKEHYRGMGKVLMNSKAMMEQVAKDEEEERKRKGGS